MATLASGAREGASSRTLLTDQLHLLVDEFNSVPVGGIVRSSELPDAAAIAFLVMTVEDEQADGKIRARDTRSDYFRAGWVSPEPLFCLRKDARSSPTFMA